MSLVEKGELLAAGATGKAESRGTLTEVRGQIVDILATEWANVY